MEALKDLIEELGGDPYALLEADPSSDISLLRKNYRSLAIKYHPDKNKQQSAKLMFLKVNQAYKYLEQEENRMIYAQYIKSIEQSRKRKENMDEKRKKFAQDLKRRQQQYQKTKVDLENQLKKSKQFFQKKMEEAQERESIKKEIFDGMGIQEYYRLISSVDIIWRQGLSFTSNMLKLGFSMYGQVQSIQLEPKRNRATVVFSSIQSCTKAVQQFIHPLMTIRYHLEAKKRQHLLKALNKQKVDKIDFSLSSQNIQRLKQLINRGSGIYKID